MSLNENCEILVKKNGSTTVLQSEVQNGTGDGFRLVRPSVSGLIQLAAGDYIELYAYIFGSRDIVAGQLFTYMNGFLVSAS